MPQPPIKEKCPYCGGELRYKGWSNNGHARRYKCANCKKTFSGDLSNLKVRVIDMPCPHCGSENVRKGGRLKSGAKRYLCNDCHKNFSQSTVVRDIRRPEKCPKCGRNHINLSGHDTKSGKQRYKCTSCGYKFVENPSQHAFKIQEKECPVCKHVGAKKAGMSSGKKQYYICLNCGHKYLEDGIYRHLTTAQKNHIIHSLIRGDKIKDISNDIGTTERTVRNIVFNYYKKEVLSEQQVSDILKYGVGCGVPVEYLHPYVGCTAHKCKEILSSHAISARSQYVRTKQEKARDWYDLDRFLA